MPIKKIVMYACAVTILCLQTELICAPSPQAEWKSLLKSNEKFVKDQTFAKQRAPLKKQQNPSVIVLSCADSRVNPESIFNKPLGSLFVVRVAGQVVDDVLIDTIEYAVNAFDARLIVVLGHAQCGAVDAALKRLQKNERMLDKPRRQLDAVLIPIEKAIIEADIDIHGAKAFEEAIQANVRYIANQLTSQSDTISDALKSKQLIIVGAEYFLDTGKVAQLFVQQ